MATLTELTTLVQSPPQALLDKITGALMVEANLIVLNSAPTPQQMNWAKAVFEDASRYRTAALGAVVASNNTATVAQITAATDAQVQTAVHTVMTVLVGP